MARLSIRKSSTATTIENKGVKMTKTDRMVDRWLELAEALKIQGEFNRYRKQMGKLLDEIIKEK